MDIKAELVNQHAINRTFRESYVVPTHDDRSESSVFKQTKKTLGEDGHYQCWICGATEKLEVHHYISEWSLENVVDFNAMKQVGLVFDVYGYSKALSKKPITTVDDIRNAMVLCKKHHTGTYTGIHSLTFSIWIMQKIGKNGSNVVVDVDGE
jgi:hypothetical protein